MKDDLTLLFIGCDGYTDFTNLAIAHFNGWDVPKINASHTESVNREDTIDVLTPEFLDPPSEGSPLGRDIMVPRILQVLKDNVKTPYVLWVMADHLYPDANFDKVKGFVNGMKKFNITNLKISRHGTPPEGIGNEVIWSSELCGEVKWAFGSSYLVNHHGSIFEKDYLIDTLQYTLDNYGPIGYDHEIAYYKGGYFSADKMNLVKQKNNDDRVMRCAYVSRDFQEPIFSCVGAGRLHVDGHPYIQSCPLPEAEPLKKFDIGEFCVGLK